MPENINIDKTVFDKSQFILAVDTKFSELFTQNTPLTVDQFFIYYDDLFFDIPDNGIKSHQELIQRSTEYLDIDPFEVERNTLLSQINELEKRVAELEEEEPEHPIFPNGSFLRYDDFSDRPEGGVIFYMDRGIRRQLNPGSELMETIVRATNSEARKLSKSEYSNGPYIQDVPSDIMNQIEVGPAFTYNDFSGKNLQEKKSKSTILLNKAIDQATLALKSGVTKTISQKELENKKTKKTFSNKNSKNTKSITK
tara:strand:- start:1127 stop:1888 length:762 start_codon:yes stop_codon:yes gene_type:complete